MTIQTILIVDDNETDRFLHEAVIQSVYPEIKVLQAVNGADALEILQNAKPDLILLDINMPHMNGLAFLEACGREIPPVFMLSSSYQDCDIDSVVSHSAVQECLVKPLTPEMVRNIMKI